MREPLLQQQQQQSSQTSQIPPYHQKNASAGQTPHASLQAFQPPGVQGHDYFSVDNSTEGGTQPENLQVHRASSPRIPFDPNTQQRTIQITQPQPPQSDQGTCLPVHAYTRLQDATQAALNLRSFTPARDTPSSVTTNGYDVHSFGGGTTVQIPQNTQIPPQASLTPTVDTDSWFPVHNNNASTHSELGSSQSAAPDFGVDTWFPTECGQLQQVSMVSQPTRTVEVNSGFPVNGGVSGQMQPSENINDMHDTAFRTMQQQWGSNTLAYPTLPVNTDLPFVNASPSRQQEQQPLRMMSGFHANPGGINNTFSQIQPQQPWVSKTSSLDGWNAQLPTQDLASSQVLNAGTQAPPSSPVNGPDLQARNNYSRQVCRNSD